MTDRREGEASELAEGDDRMWTKYASLSLALAACNGQAVPESYGVQDWSGPPTNFVGIWRANAVRDQSGALIPDGGVLIAINEASPTQDDPLVSSGGEPCLTMVQGCNAPITPDGHGFDCTLLGGEVALHARVDKTGELHGVLDTRKWPIVSPNNTGTGTCTKVFSFTATWSPFVAK